MREGFDDLLEKNIEIGNLFAYYGNLLTERQQTALRYHYEEDLSLSEIADSFGVSRQNIDDMMRRSVQKLCYYEEKLGMMKQERQFISVLQQIAEHISAAIAEEHGNTPSSELEEAHKLVAALMARVNDTEWQE